MVTVHVIERSDGVCMAQVQTVCTPTVNRHDGVLDEGRARERLAYSWVRCGRDLSRSRRAWTTREMVGIKRVVFVLAWYSHGIRHRRDLGFTIATMCLVRARACLGGKRRREPSGVQYTRRRLCVEQCG